MDYHDILTWYLLRNHNLSQAYITRLYSFGFCKDHHDICSGLSISAQDYRRIIMISAQDQNLSQAYVQIPVFSTCKITCVDIIQILRQSRRHRMDISLVSKRSIKYIYAVAGYESGTQQYSFEFSKDYLDICSGLSISAQDYRRIIMISAQDLNPSQDYTTWL